MPLDPQVVAYRSVRAAADTPPLYTQTLAEARAADPTAIRAGGGDVEPVNEVRDTHLPGPAGDLPVRVYRPAGDGPLPTLLYFFGGGDSAGGNLAAVTLLARATGPRLAGQLLVYPNTDQRADRAPSGDEDPLLFNRHSVDWYRRHYLPDPADAADPLASPLLAADLAGLPPALVVTAEYDPLRAEGERYAERLREAGVPVTLSRYPGMVHGFFAMPGVFDARRRAQDQAAAFLRDRFAPAGSPTDGARPAGARAVAGTGGPADG
ncbi:alpha/beta hydrolase [Micromonospora sp. IBSANI012]|uniref:alpha/beta hydrolase n=1 Tax=Micromonospora sp. IBSANI012 TaxID=3457761 RepID=UPI00405A3587